MQASAVTQDASVEDSDYNWLSVCATSDLIPNSGVCALVNGIQIAIFCIAIPGQASPSLYAVSNFDPIGKANVISRGMIGSVGTEVVVASPLYKQHFSLLTGQCIEAPEHSLRTFAVRVTAQVVEISMLARPTSPVANFADDQAVL